MRLVAAEHVIGRENLPGVQRPHGDGHGPVRDRRGTVLVTSAGYTLYMFVPDHRRAVTCTGLCTSYWPPLKLPSGYAVAAGPGVNASLLGSDPDPGGGRVVTYNGWPLYTYASDVQPGQATGQGIDLNGGEWYVMRPSGAPLISAP